MATHKIETFSRNGKLITEYKFDPLIHITLSDGLSLWAIANIDVYLERDGWNYDAIRLVWEDVKQNWIKLAPGHSENSRRDFEIVEKLLISHTPETKEYDKPVFDPDKYQKSTIF